MFGNLPFGLSWISGLSALSLSLLWNSVHTTLHDLICQSVSLMFWREIHFQMMILILILILMMMTLGLSLRFLSFRLTFVPLYSAREVTLRYLRHPTNWLFYITLHHDDDDDDDDDDRSWWLFPRARVPKTSTGFGDRRFVSSATLIWNELLQSLWKLESLSNTLPDSWRRVFCLLQRMETYLLVMGTNDVYLLNDDDDTCRDLGLGWSWFLYVMGTVILLALLQ